MDNTPVVAQCKYYIGGAASLSESARQRDVAVTRARCTAAKLVPYEILCNLFNRNNVLHT